MALLLPKQNRKRSETHRRWIASLPCCVTGVTGQTQAAHVSQGRCSMGMKADDQYCVPLAYPLHAFQHQKGEVRFWASHRKSIEQVKSLALNLHKVSGNTEAALQILSEWK